MCRTWPRVLPTDLLSGQVSAVFASLSTAEAHPKAGSLRIVAVATKERLPAYPDLPRSRNPVSLTSIRRLGSGYSDPQTCERNWLRESGATFPPPWTRRKAPNIFGTIPYSGGATSRSGCFGLANRSFPHDNGVSSRALRCVRIAVEHRVH